MNELAKKKQLGPIDTRMSHINFNAKPELVEKKKGFFSLSSKDKKDKKGKKETGSDSDDDDSECEIQHIEDKSETSKEEKKPLFGERKKCISRLIS